MKPVLYLILIIINSNGIFDFFNNYFKLGKDGLKENL